MAVKKKNIFLYFIKVTTILLFIVLILNVFLNYRLESYLKKELGRRVTEATDGFYSLTFDDLSINFFTGELNISGVDFRPSPEVFDRWAVRDSLPINYIKAHIHSIDFRGVNLTWTWNYRRLNFDIFEIESPYIQIFDSYYSQRYYRKPKNTSSKTLYELIEPYIDVLAVRRLNLDNATVEYTVEDPVTPSLYALRDVSLRMYDFWLDTDSEINGKLLYCDNFEFVTNQSQTLLVNSNFVLETDSIYLSTRDSVIYIQDINLIPQISLWNARGRSPDMYLDGQVESVEVNGIEFNRQNSLSYLTARDFRISSSDLQIFNYADSNKEEPEIKEETDSSDNSLVVDSIPRVLSLYEIISPVLYSVSIDNILLEKTKLKYSVAVKDTVEIYNVDNFDFYAKGFQVDSVSEVQHGFWYSRQFGFEATDIKGLMIARNHSFEVGKMLFDTEKGYFKLENARLAPLSVKTPNDYVIAYVDTVSMEGLIYDKGIEANLFKIDSPKIRYFKSPYRKTQTKEKQTRNTQADIDDIINPFIKYLSINNIRLNNANVSYIDRHSKGITSKVENFDFYATRFFIDDSTRLNNDLFFICEDLGFRFRNLANYIEEENYLLSVADGKFSSKTGILDFNNIRLIPQKDTWKNAPSEYMDIGISSIRAEGIDYKFNRRDKIFVCKGFHIIAPHVILTKAYTQKDEKKKEETLTLRKSLSEYVSKIYTERIHIENVSFLSEDMNSTDGIHITLDDFKSQKLVWDIADSDGLRIEQVKFQSPRIDVRNHSLPDNKYKKQTKKIREQLISFFDGIGINSLNVNDLLLSVKNNKEEYELTLNKFDLQDGKWSFVENNSFINLASATITNPDLFFKRVISVGNNVDSLELEKDKKEIYDILNTLADNISIGEFNMENAKIDYSDLRGYKDSFSQNINDTDFGFTDLKINNVQRNISVEDVRFHTQNLNIPVSDGFYNLQVGEVDLKQGNFSISNVYFVSPYPKAEFAYWQPNHADWFDVSVDKFQLNGIDIPYYLNQNVLKAKSGYAENILLQNFKNQNIEIEHNIMPMFYENIQKAPVRFEIPEMDVKNFTVIYEELPKNGIESGIITFENMNGMFSGFTNIVSYPEQFIRLDADGFLMGKGAFTATWMIPVDSLYDRFVLDGHIKEFELSAINRIVTPMAPAFVQSGTVKDLTFSLDASSKGGTTDMLFLYRDLKVGILNKKEDHATYNSFYSWLANAVLKDDNPDYPERPRPKPRYVHLTIERDPYHSTFNYFWQLLQPAVVESVGISKGVQDFAKGVGTLVKNVKNFFKFGKKAENMQHDREEVK